MENELPGIIIKLFTDQDAPMRKLPILQEVHDQGYSLVAVLHVRSYLEYTFQLDPARQLMAAVADYTELMSHPAGVINNVSTGKTTPARAAAHTSASKSKNPKSKTETK